MSYEEGQWAYVDGSYGDNSLMRARTKPNCWEETDKTTWAEDAVTNVRPVVILEVDDDLLDFAASWRTVPSFKVDKAANRIAVQPAEKPAIEEPQRFGAQVRLKDGRKAVRASSWYVEGNGFSHSWSDLDVAEVLFERATS